MALSGVSRRWCDDRIDVGIDDPDFFVVFCFVVVACGALVTDTSASRCSVRRYLVFVLIVILVFVGSTVIVPRQSAVLGVRLWWRRVAPIECGCERHELGACRYVDAAN